MTWPFQSPDHSLIELVWDEIDRKVQSNLPNNEQGLFTHMRTSWEPLLLPYFYNKEIIPRILSTAINTRGEFFEGKENINLL